MVKMLFRMIVKLNVDQLRYRMGPFIQDKDLMEKKMAMVNKYGQMVLNMMECGPWIWLTVRAL